MPVLVKDLFLAVLLVCLTMVLTSFVQASRSISAGAEESCGIEPTANKCSANATSRNAIQEN
jgi:hypothetical protein